MVKEIKYTGFTASPSDYECPDGDLAAVLNVVPEEGSLSPVLPPRQLFQLSDGGNVRFVHETSYIRNFIILYPDNRITWRTQEDPDDYSHGTLTHDFTGRTIHQINAIGNTIIVLADDGMHYFIWKGYRNGSEHEGDEPKEYLYLGTHLPELPISFGLDSASEYKGANYENNFLIKNDDIKFSEEYGGFFFESDIYKIYNFENYTIFTFFYDKIKVVQDMLLGAANKLIEKAADLGYFCMPFLVRYAYRLYDGSLHMHSSPVLMMASDGIPFCHSTKVGDTRWDFSASAFFFRLDYAAKASAVEKLSEWKDIIKSVDIFISSPIYKYDPSAQEWDRTYAEDSIWDMYLYRRGHDEFFNYMTNKIYVSNDHAFDHEEGVIKDYPYTKRNADQFHYNYTDDIIHLPKRKESDIIKDINDCNKFYLLESIEIKDLKTDRTIIRPERGYLSNLETKEMMSDDYDGHDSIIAKYSFGYNARLNICNLRKSLFGGFDASTLFHFTEDYYGYLVSAKVFFFIKQDNKEFIVGGNSSSFSSNTPFVYLYYPNINTEKAVIAYSSFGTTKLYELPMVKHEKLNGAVFFGGYDFDLFDGTHEYSGNYPSVTSESNRVLEIPNKIYTSEVNNPFVFPVSNISTIGVGTIFAIISASKALSQGQFGQHPLYAFTDEGVWALEITKTGSILPAQPFTRDVCINKDSITQLDSSVLFATDRGLMLISGSNSICISDDLDYSQVFQVSSLPQADKILALAGFTQDDLNYVAFREFIKGCRMIYSYNLQRIIAFNSQYPYAYVYSLKSKNWGMMPSTITYAIPSYPEAIAQLADGSIVDYSSIADQKASRNGNSINGVLITRPLKLDAPDVLKTVNTVIQRGNFQRGHVKTAIYGSRDLIHWFVVWTSTDHYLRGFRGTPYKYFRLVLLCDLDHTESIYGCSIQYTTRFTNRLR
ncbi:MAG: hypothetical protein MJZ12_01385 [Prevotella sp.]|nr:hypothetical protein [Prevotella sp.]